MHLKQFLICIISVTLGYAKADENTNYDEDAPKLKCDACKIIVQKFAESFKSMEKIAGNPSLQEDEYLEAAEATCDDNWGGYDVAVIDGTPTLLQVSDNTHETNIWSTRLQDFCDEMLTDIEEKILYSKWSEGIRSMEQFMCNGNELFSACSSDNFGDWPGDDYDDDDDDFELLHDEF